MIFAVLFDMSIKCTVRAIRLHHYTQLMHGSVRIGSPFYKNSRSSKICQAYKTCSFIKYKSKNIKCARVSCKQCQEHCLMTTNVEKYITIDTFSAFIFDNQDASFSLKLLF